MFERYAKLIHKFRFLIIAAWLAIAVIVHLALPQLNNVVSSHATQFLPNSSSVVQAQNLLNRVDPKHSSGSTEVVAIHNPKGLTAADKSYFTQALEKLNNHKTKYGVETVQGMFNTNSSVANKFLSKDGTVEIATVGFKGGDVSQPTANAMKKVETAFTAVPSDAKVLYTGDAPIQNDNIKISMDGAEKTAGVTVALVLVILLVVFRSVIAPLLTLLSIGLSYLISSNVVAALGDLGLPVSTFTNTFMIGIIFGAGTDYSIIVMNRFREETGHGLSPIEALASAFRGIGKTVLFSSLTVFVSFATLYFAHFGLFKSAVGVAAGVAITLFACLTFLPALMMALGRFVFWPRKAATSESHKPSRLWHATGALSLRYPWWTLLCLALVLTPVGLLFTNLRTFDPTSDIPSAPSVQGLHVVSGAFGAGEVLPMNIVVKSSKNLRTSKGLTTIENISKSVADLPFVQEVDSATRPTGTVTTSFELSNQNQQAAKGLDKVHQGLATLAGKLPSGSSNAFSSTGQLVSGAQSVASGANQLANGLGRTASSSASLTKGAKQVASGATSLASGASQASSGAKQVASGASKLSSGLKAAGQGASSVATGASQLSSSLQSEATATSQLANAIAAWTKAHPTNANDPSWQQIVKLAQGTASGASQASAGAQKLSTGATSLSSAMGQLQNGASQVSQGASQLAGATSKLSSGSSQVANGAKSVAGGNAQLQSGLQQLTSGATSLSSGASKVATGVGSLNQGLQSLGKGQTQLHTGIESLANGVNSVSTALKNSSDAAKTGDPGFYIPQSVINTNKSLGQALDAYISPDGHVANIKVVLKTDPYSMKAIDELPNLENQAQAAFNASPIHTGTLMYAGTTPQQAELNNTSNSDFRRMMILILSAIFILLVILLRSILAPLYVIISLAGTYYVTMALLQMVSVHVLGKTGISWTVPFFTLLLLVALGVDYSIFLMSRFDEELHRREGINIRSAMLHAMRNMGGVVFSAAAIMAGTFGSMAVSGVTSLIEIGVSVVIGLAIYALVLLAFFVPACTAIVGRAHFWPFMRVSSEDQSISLDQHGTSME